jgi:hypothetical protein
LLYGSSVIKGQPFLQANGHGVARFLHDRLPDIGLDRQLVGAVTHDHEGASERMTIDGSSDRNQPRRPEDLC